MSLSRKIAVSVVAFGLALGIGSGVASANTVAPSHHGGPAAEHKPVHRGPIGHRPVHRGPIRHHRPVHHKPVHHRPVHHKPVPRGPIPRKPIHHKG